MARPQHRLPKAKSAIAQPERSADTPAAAGSPAYIEPERRHSMICEAAYFLAERRNFCPGQEMEDWLQAEREIDRALTAAAPAALIDA
ncbi:MAG TPA: DUF2934 domain-containing protein [Steroidobacteraceae bacterium]